MVLDTLIAEAVTGLLPNNRATLGTIASVTPNLIGSVNFVITHATAKVPTIINQQFSVRILLLVYHLNNNNKKKR